MAATISACPFGSFLLPLRGADLTAETSTSASFFRTAFAMILPLPSKSTLRSCSLPAGPLQQALSGQNQQQPLVQVVHTIDQFFAFCGHILRNRREGLQRHIEHVADIVHQQADASPL